MGLTRERMPKRTGFIIHPTYHETDEGAQILLYGRLEDGRSFCSIHPMRPYFFIRECDLARARKFGTFDVEQGELTTFASDRVVKILVRKPREIPPLRDAFLKEDIPCYEADVRFEYRFLIDCGLRGAVELDGKERKGEHVDLLISDASATPADYMPKNLRILSFDIETDRRAKRLFSISLATNEGFERVLLISDAKKLPKTECYADEPSLLERFCALVREIDPDVITGWNCIDFDLADLQERFRRHSIPFELGRSSAPVRLRIEESFFRESRADIEGRCVLDGIHLLRSNFYRLDDYKLNTAAAHFLGEEKLIVGDDRHEEIERAYQEDQQKLVLYNLKDSHLALDVALKSGAFALALQRSRLTGMPLDRVAASIASLDMLYLHELRKRGFVAITARYAPRDERTIGGYVMQSKPGIYDHVLVCDFKSLYPSLMRTFNIDPLMLDERCEGERPIKAPNGACFLREQGILPGLLESIMKRRDAARRAGDEHARFALKILMNSFYGVMASPNCRFYNPKIANAITGFARHFIQMLERRLRKQGFEVIYGDTDSLFVDLKLDDEQQAKTQGQKIVEEANRFLTQHIEQEYEVQSHLELEFEKVFVRFLMPRARSGEAGAKKRYAGMLRENGAERLEFVGLEFVRRDWTAIAKRFQQELLNRIFHDKPVESFVQHLVSEIREGKLDDELIYRKAIRKELDEYTKTTPPHVKAARKLGKLEGNIIDYVMTSDGPEPVQAIEHPIDYDHYIDKQIRPIADALLVFTQQSFDDILKGSRQTSLEGF